MNLEFIKQTIALFEDDLDYSALEAEILDFKEWMKHLPDDALLEMNQEVAAHQEDPLASPEESLNQMIIDWFETSMVYTNPPRMACHNFVFTINGDIIVRPGEEDF